MSERESAAPIPQDLVEMAKRAEEPGPADYLWLECATLPDGNQIKYLGSWDESTIVPVTEDGGYVLVQRPAPAMGEASITTVLSKANIGAADPALVAMQALHKIHFPGLKKVTPESTGLIRPWKYLASDTTCFRVDLPMSAAELSRTARIQDEKTESIVIVSEAEFFAAINSGEIADLRATNAVQLAMAKKQWAVSPANDPFSGDPVLLAQLGSIPILKREVIGGNLGSEWFRTAMRAGDKVILRTTDQAQALPVINDEDGTPIVCLAEPSIAHGQINLGFASGSIDKDQTGAETAIKELAQEAGYVGVNARPLVQSAYPAQLYLQVRSSVYIMDVIGRCDKTGMDEFLLEQGVDREVPADRLRWYIKRGYVTDGSALAGMFAWMREEVL